MAHHLVVRLLIGLLLSSVALAQGDRLLSEAYLGEKRLDSYAERYQPLIFQDLYRGSLSFQDEVFFGHYFAPYSFEAEREFSLFLRSELGAGLTCSNELLSQHFEDLRYSYRLITMSYLIEGQWHLKSMSDHFQLKGGCDFDLQKWAQTCSPRSTNMKKFISRLRKYAPKYDDLPSPTYKKGDWWKEFTSGKLQNYSQYRLQRACKGRCLQDDLPARFRLACEENRRLMDLICSESDELYGLSSQRDAYFLLGQSNIINTYNKRGEAMGCLRRFSEVLAHREVNYSSLELLFPVLQNHLRSRYQERFLQGRVFFYGAAKEFEDKGLADVFVEEQKLKIATVKQEMPEPAPEKKAETVKAEPKKPGPVKVAAAPAPKKKEVVEIKAPVKSAFLQAAEVRAAQNLPMVEVDMLKLKYDYVFTLNMMNVLSERLKTFMTREALVEMMTYDKLGTAEGPVPLLFIKFMIDMQEHQGLWNMISVLGDKFYVSNEIDVTYKPGPEYVQIVNDESTGRQWQLLIIRP